ncbi:MAG: response regulator transcription factor [Gammaproteobacteria bacterium]|nr:response regulator transcription factor [Gammaproteobacteria bacterium]
MTNTQEKSRVEEPPKLLLVDDDPTFCQVLGQALEKRGFNVSIAENLTDAIALAESCKPEYAIVDLRIGQESGLPLVKQLKALNENTRIVMLTGYASIATAVEAIKLGAVHYLTKPTDADEIVTTLNRDTGDANVTPACRPISVQRLEWEHLQKVLADCDGNISAAARALNMHRRTLQRKLNKKPVRH